MASATLNTEPDPRPSSASLTFVDPGYKLGEIATAMAAVADLVEDCHPASAPTQESVAAIMRAFATALDGARRPSLLQ